MRAVSSIAALYAADRLEFFSGSSCHHFVTMHITGARATDYETMGPGKTKL